MSTLLFQLSRYTGVANDISKLSIINASVGFSCPDLQLSLPGIINGGVGLTSVSVVVTISVAFRMG